MPTESRTPARFHLIPEGNSLRFRSRAAPAVTSSACLWGLPATASTYRLARIESTDHPLDPIACTAPPGLDLLILGICFKVVSRLGPPPHRRISLTDY